MDLTQVQGDAEFVDTWEHIKLSFQFNEKDKGRVWATSDSFRQELEQVESGYQGDIFVRNSQSNGDGQWANSDAATLRYHYVFDQGGKILFEKGDYPLMRTVHFG